MGSKGKTGKARAQVKAPRKASGQAGKHCWAGKDCRADSLGFGFNNLLSAREGGAENAYGARIKKVRKTEQKGGRKEEAAQQQTPGEITSSPHRFVIVS